MPGGDAGDEFVEHIMQKVEMAAQQMMMRSMMAGAYRRSAAPSAASVYRNLSDKANEQVAELREEIENERAGVNPEGKWEAFADPNTRVVAFAVDRPGAMRLDEQLARAGIASNEFDFMPPSDALNDTGLYAFSVDRDALASAGELYDYLDKWCSPEAVKNFLAERGEGNLTLYFANESDMLEVEAKLLEAGIVPPNGNSQFSGLHACPATGGLYELQVPEGELGKIEPGFSEMLERWSYENLTEQLGFEAAITRFAPELAEQMLAGEQTPGSFTPGAPDNKAFGFKTVSWDPSGEILTSSLKDAGIPFEATKVTDSLLKVELSPEYAPTVEGMASVMCERVKGMSTDRFEFPEGFADPVEAAPWRGKLEPDVANVVKAMLDVEGIEYTASQTGLDGQVEIVADLSDPDALKRGHQSIVQREIAVVTPEQAESMQKVHDARNAANRMRQDKRAQEAARNTARAEREKRQLRTPEKDQREMQRSARERGTGPRTPERVVGKGAL